MVYISEQGVISESKSWWRLSSISDLFWNAVNFIVLFFRSLVQPDFNSKESKFYNGTDYRRGPGGGPPRPPGRRFGGFRNFGNAPAGPPPMAGGG
ncbi:selenoprotein K-like [Tachypleus tridentatus]|uniref:selenoprotein K-like n=1 Tax=Tachypleus tridentatus TaxID=6853 RepID=UPI003FD329E9